MATRSEVLAELTEEVLSVTRPHPLRVGIDGCSGAGKTTLADELADVLRARTDREIIRASLDYFKQAPALRTKYPIESPESYYFEMYDNAAIRERLLLPLGPDGDRRYTTAIRAANAQSALDSPIGVAADDAILLADGAFLQRAELNGYWDLRIYVHVSFETVLRRGTERDQAWMASAEAAAERYRNRYIPGERIYLDQVHPADRADLLLNNEDPHAPTLTRRPAAS
ncbi:uridine kinase [Kribbella hippodromi]|uniref:Uridine kinase n=1 Tax=Kribbella hippodromi TaxID=434347 RepID=A0ABP4QDN9_9ACTN